MLRLYRRHRTSCPHTSERYRRCSCPIYVEGSLRGENIRKSLDLTSWEAASDLIARWNAAGEIGVVKPEVVSVASAVERFFEDAAAQELKPATIAKYRVLLKKQLLPWCFSKGYSGLKNLGVDELTRFRATWADGPLSMRKKQERLAAFFHFCKVREWVPMNPILSIRLPEVTPNPTLPFSQDEMKRIVEACESYPARNSYGHDNRARMKAFVLLFRHSGLRIRDAVTIEWSRPERGRAFLYTQKTGTPVFVPLPPICLAAIDALKSDKRPFWTGNGDPTSAVADWQRSLRKLFALANVEGGHAHRFRDTFSVELLLRGVPIETVSNLAWALGKGHGEAWPRKGHRPRLSPP